MELWDLAKIFFTLILLTGIMYGLLFLVKKYLYSFDKKGAKDLKFNILSTQVIMPKKFISLVRFQNKIFILGISDNSINLIDKMDSDEFEIPAPEDDFVGNKSFMDHLKKNLGIR